MYKHSYLKIWLLIFLLGIISGTAVAESAGDYQEKLDAIRGKISDVVTALQKNMNKRDTVRDELKKLEVTIAKTSKSLRKTRLSYKNESKKLEKTKKELKKLTSKLNEQRKLLAQQVRSAYAMGQQPQLKMMLNQQDPSEMGRAMVYYSYLNRARSQQIEDFLESIEKQRTLEQEVASTTRELEVLVRKREDERQSLSIQRGKRKKLLAKLEKDIDNQQLTLQDLETSRGRIEGLLKSLGELLADIPSGSEHQKPFGDLKGKLPWPVKGTLTASYGARRNQGDLTWNGVVIKADYDTQVRAVSNGRVAFADWLQGYGFITIIDHNDGYMSLYGYTQELYKQVGDWVEASEVIATVGDSGGQQSSGLYFEIRKQGKPVNPKQWCSSKVRHIALQDKS